MPSDPPTLPQHKPHVVPHAIREGPRTEINGRHYPVVEVDGYPIVVTSRTVRRCKCGLPFVGFQHPEGETFVKVLGTLDLTHMFQPAKGPDGFKQVVEVCPRAIGLDPFPDLEGL